MSACTGTRRRGRAVSAGTEKEEAWGLTVIRRDGGSGGRGGRRGRRRRRSRPAREAVRRGGDEDDGDMIQGRRGRTVGVGVPATAWQLRGDGGSPRARACSPRPRGRDGNGVWLWMTTRSRGFGGDGVTGIGGGERPDPDRVLGWGKRARGEWGERWGRAPSPVTALEGEGGERGGSGVGL